MAGAVAGSLIFNTRIDTNGFSQGLDDVSDQTDGLSNSFGKLKGAIIAAFSIAAIKEFGSAILEAASDLNEVQNVVDTTFESNSKAIDEFAKTAIAKFGLSELQAKQFSSTIGAMFKSMGLGKKDILDMSEGISGLSGDVASFYNLDPEEAFEKLRSGISGETEPLKQLGINMSVANLEAFALSEGITKAYDSMSQAEQATLRYKYIMKATADAQGDFSKTSDGYANQTRMLENNFKTLAATLGDLILPAAALVVSAINDIVMAITKLIQSAQDGNVVSILILSIIAALGILAVAIALYSVKILLAQKLTSLWAAISSAAAATTSALGAAFAFLTSPIGLIIIMIAALTVVIVLLVKHWDEVKKAAVSVWESIKKTWSAAGKWFNDTFVKPVKDGINSVLGFVEGMVNGFIGGINKMIDALNELNFTVPDWVPKIGGESFGFDIAQIQKVSIPRLASGAVIPPNSEFLAILGDQKRGTNIESPLSTIEQALRNVLKERGSSNSGTGTAILNVDGRELARTIFDYVDGENTRRGVRLIDGV